MDKKAFLLLSISFWSCLTVAHDYHGDEPYSPLIPRQSDGEAIQRLERQKMLNVQTQLKSEAFVNSIYLSALQELDGAAYNLRTINTDIKEALQYLKTIPIKEDVSSRQQQSKNCLDHLVNQLGTFSPQPAVTQPLAFNLKMVPNFFTGRLEHTECKGFFSGTVQKADARFADDTWVFFLTIGDQNFEGKLNLCDGICPNLLSLTSKNLINNKISFQVDAHLSHHWRDEKATKAAWTKLLGLQNGNNPVVIYSPSQSLPKGIKIDELPVIPTAIYYKPIIHYLEPEQPANNLWSQFYHWLWGPFQPIPILDGMFQFADGKYQTSGKVISEDDMKQSWNLTTYGGAKLTIHSHFDYQQNWDVPLILWRRYELKLATLFNFSQSIFDESLKQSILKFDAKPLCQELETIFLTYLMSDKEQEDVDIAIESLAHITQIFDNQLEMLSTRRGDLLKVIENNRRKFNEAYQEGQLLLTKISR